MGKDHVFQSPALVLALLFLSSCATLYEPNPYNMGPPLSRLTRTIQTIVLFPEGGQPVPDDQLLEAAFRERPELISFFQGLHLRVKRSGTEVVVLVCSADGKYALMEDASWSSEIDQEWYRTDPKHPAEFSLDPATRRE